MLVRTMQELESQGRVVSISHGKSAAVRLVTKADGLTFSISEAARSRPGKPLSGTSITGKPTTCAPGARRSRIARLASAGRWNPGVFYCVGPKDKHHVVRDDTRLRIISVFNPPRVGNETHDADGAYPPTGQIPPGRERMFVRTLEDVRKAGRVVETGGFATSELCLRLQRGPASDNARSRQVPRGPTGGAIAAGRD